MHDELTMSHHVAQWMLADLGRRTGHDVHIAVGDWRAHVNGVRLGDVSLGDLPFAAPERALRVMRHVDVVWFRKGCAQPKALFEVEHTTSITSGLLRMSDVLATSEEPSEGWQCAIVAPDTRRSRFAEACGRPTFQATGLTRVCTFLSYSDLRAFHRAGLMPHSGASAPAVDEQVAASARAPQSPQQFT